LIQAIADLLDRRYVARHRGQEQHFGHLRLALDDFREIALTSRWTSQEASIKAKINEAKNTLDLSAGSCAAA
jgi:hypothetical protein